MVALTPVPSFTPLFGYKEAHGASEAPYPTQTYILLEKIQVRNSVDNLLALSPNAWGLQVKGKHL